MRIARLLTQSPYRSWITRICKNNPSFIYVNRIVLFVLFLLPIQANAQSVSLLFAGDAMQHRHQLDHALRDGKYDYSSYFRLVKETIAAADIAVVNLETTLGGEPFRGYPRFCSPDAYAVALKEAGFDLFLTANNHILDRSSKGLHRTLQVLDSLGVKHTGTFRNPEEREECYPLLIEKKGIRFAFLNYTYGTNGIRPIAPDVVNYIDSIQIRQDIRRAQSFRADLLIAHLHWGTEYQPTPNKKQKQLARWLMDEGVDIVIGGHPHVIQPAQAVMNEAGETTHLVVYSLGNLISGMTAVNTNGGQMVQIVVEKQTGKARIASCRYRLIYVDKIPNGNKIDYRILPLAARDEAIDRPAMRRFATNARKLLDTWNVGVEEEW